MLIKTNREIDYRLSVIARKGKISKNEVITKVIEAFIERFEKKHGVIPERTEKKKGSEIWDMYDLYKAKYFQIYNIEFISDPKKEKINARNLKNIRNKIVEMAMSKAEESKSIIAFDENDITMAFGLMLERMPDWWLQNSFTIPSICKNFDKILSQIENGKRKRKNALDDFINGFEKSGYQGV